MYKHTETKMPAGEKEAIELWRLRAMHDSSIRGYYTYELLSKLLISQEKSLLEHISVPAGIVASVLGIFGFLQLPASRDLIFLGYLVAILVIAAAPIVERRLRKRNGLDDVVYVGILLDEAAKYANEIMLANDFEQSEAVKSFVNDTKDALVGTLSCLREKIHALRDTGEFPKCLEQLGRSEKWAKELNAEIVSFVNEGFL